jgi:hypothetical protein
MHKGAVIRGRGVMSNHQFETLSILDVRFRLRADELSMKPAVESCDARPYAAGILQTLVVQGDNALRDLSVAEVVGREWDVESTWASAWAQTRVLERPTEINAIDASGVEIIHLFNDPLGASFVPYLADVLPIHEHGALVSMPVEHSLIVRPIDGGDEIVPAAHTMIPITRQVHSSGPQSLSAHVYWWRDGLLTLVPTYFASDGIRFYPPTGLAELIDQTDDSS